LLVYTICAAALLSLDTGDASAFSGRGFSKIGKVGSALRMRASRPMIRPAARSVLRGAAQKSVLRESLKKRLPMARPDLAQKLGKSKIAEKLRQPLGRPAGLTPGGQLTGQLARPLSTGLPNVAQSTRRGIFGRLGPQIRGAGLTPAVHRPLQPFAAEGGRLARLGVPLGGAQRAFLKVPPRMIHARFAPFIQRHWKRAVFWTFIAGIGYVTVPSHIYPAFVTYVEAGDYGPAVTLLTDEAMYEQDTRVVRYAQRPRGVQHRHVVATPEQPGAAPCYKHFVERSWNQPFGWVLVANVGDVSVPDAHYETFVDRLQQSPPDHSGACELLKEAAMEDTAAPIE